jgi:hypothetical protein
MISHVDLIPVIPVTQRSLELAGALRPVIE